MNGRWMLTGTIAKQQTTRDVNVHWILNREYIRIHEVSREENAAGGPEYEAWIHIAWDAKKSEYAVFWRGCGIGHAIPKDFTAHRNSFGCSGRTSEFPRTNTALTILRKKFEELREPGASAYLPHRASCDPEALCGSTLGCRSAHRVAATRAPHRPGGTP